MRLPSYRSHSSGRGRTTLNGRDYPLPGEFNSKESKRAVRRLYGDTDANEFGPLQYKAVRQYIVEGKNRTSKDVKARKDAPVPSRKHINEVMERVKRIFKWAAGEGLIPAAIHVTLRKIEPLKMGRTTANLRVIVDERKILFLFRGWSGVLVHGWLKIPAKKPLDAR